MSQEQSFGRFVRQRRRELDLTQEELARRVGCAAITIRKIEADDARPSVQVAERLAMALAIPLDDRAEFVRQARAARPEAAEPAPTLSPAPEEIGREDLTGRAIRGYALAEKIGAGGMGVVYRAVQPLVEREVALKIILPAFANHPDFIRRFEAEAQLVARLEHPHIVPLYDYWREPGVAYLVMRLLRGGSVQTLLQGGPLPIETVSRLLEQICSALHAAHRIGVIHRDLKPGNVLLDEDSNAYLADFGIAKNLGNPNLEDQTQVDALVGSPHYMSPEQIRSLSVRPQTDIYCLGVMLYEMLTGSLPFIGPTPLDLIQQHISAPLPPLAARREGLPAALDDVISRAAAKDPQERYPDVLSLLDDFRCALSGVVTRPAFPPVEEEEAETEVVNPFKGLRAFGEADAEDFFGRETLVQQLLARLGEGGDLARFLAVVGPSGSGKSSVVRAGLIPALRRGGLVGSESWFIVDLVPGLHPFEELEAALLRIAVNPPASLLAQLKESERGLLRAVNRILPADESVELVLVIDQFEEVFTLLPDDAERALLLSSLVTAVLDERSRVRVVLTLRADFTDRPLRYVDFGELVQRRSEFVLPLTPDELERAIHGPARRVGLKLEPGLISTMIREVGDQPGALPLLQYALTELFEKREGRTLTKAAYESIGGVLGALGRRAEEVFASLDEAGQAAARQLFLRLVTLGEGVEDTRRRVLRAELESLTTDGRPPTADGGQPMVSGRLSAVIDAFGKHRLLSFDRDPLTRGPTVEVAHEALLREWPRLREWLNESRAGVRMQRMLANEAAEWVVADRDPSFLLTGSRLEQFEGWAAETEVALTQDERAYLDASIAERQRREAEEMERQRHELEAAQKLAETEKGRAEAEKQRAEEHVRAAQQLRRRAWGLVIFLAAAIGAAWFAFNQRNTAQNNFVTAERIRLAAQAQLALDQGEEATLPALLALRSLSYGYSPEADAALLSALSRGFSRQVFVHPDQVPSVAFSPDGKHVLTGGNDGIARLWDVQTADVIRQFPGHTEFVWAVFSPDGKGVLTGSGDGTAILWEAETAREVWRLPKHSAGILAIALSRDGKYIVTNDGPTARLWDAQTGKALDQFSNGHTDTILGASFSPDGRYLATASNDRTAILWDLATGRVVRPFTGHAAGVDEAIFSPDGRFLLTASLDTTARLWEVETGEVICRFLGHTNFLRGAAFSPDGRFVITGSVDKTARLWDVATCREVRRFTGHTAVVVGVAFSPDGQYVLTSGVDRTARLWDVETEIEPRLFGRSRGVVHVSDVKLLMFTPDGKQVLIGNGSGGVDLWDIETREIAESSGFETGFINAMAFSPTGEYVLTASGDGTATLWDSRSGQAVGHFAGHTGPLRDVKFSPNGRKALTGSEDGTARLWDVQTSVTIYRLSGHDKPVHSVAFSPDGRFGLTGGDDATTRLWDLETGREIRSFVAHSGAVRSVAFSPDGRFVLTGSDDSTACLWNLESGRVIQQFIGHTGQVLTAIFSPDGRYVLTGSADRMVRLWDIETGQVVRQFPGHRNPVETLAFSPDGRLVLAAELEAGYLWRVNLDEVIAIACDQLARDFTSDERALYTISGDEPTCPVRGQ